MLSLVLDIWFQILAMLRRGETLAMPLASDANDILRLRAALNGRSTMHGPCWVTDENCVDSGNGYDSYGGRSSPEQTEYEQDCGFGVPSVGPWGEERCEDWCALNGLAYLAECECEGPNEEPALEAPMPSSCCHNDLCTLDDMRNAPWLQEKEQHANAARKRLLSLERPRLVNWLPSA